MELLKAQATISELLVECDRLLGYARKLDRSHLWLHEAQEQAQVEASASAYLASAHVVARHFGIALKVQLAREK